MEPMHVSIRVPKTAELMAEQLRRQIVRGELLEGNFLPTEAALMTAYGISRPTLREAFRVLESEGLIDVHRGSRGGARVRVPTDEVVARYAGLVLEHRRATIADVSVASAVLEADAVAILARRGDPADAAALRAAVEQAEATNDPVWQFQTQHQFHQVLVERTGNRTIALLHGAIQRIMAQAGLRRASSQTEDTHAARHVGARTHRRLIVLLEAGDAEGAARLWKHHIRATNDYLQHDGVATQVLDLLN